VLADGTRKTFVVAEKDAEKVKKGSVVSFALDKDDRFVLADTDLTLLAGHYQFGSGDRSAVADGVKVYADSNTRFIFSSWRKDGTLFATTTLGVKNVEVDDDVVIVCDPDEQTILWVFVLAEQEQEEEEEEEEEEEILYAVVLDDSYLIEEADNGDWHYIYNVFADGDEVELSFLSKQSVTPGEIIAYTMRKGAARPAQSKLITATVEYIGEGFVVLGDEEYTVAKRADLITVITCYDADEEFDYIDVEEDGEFVRDEQVSFYADKKNVIQTAFFFEEEY